MACSHCDFCNFENVRILKRMHDLAMTNKDLKKAEEIAQEIEEWQKLCGYVDPELLQPATRIIERLCENDRQYISNALKKAVSSKWPHEDKIAILQDVKRVFDESSMSPSRSFTDASPTVSQIYYFMKAVEEKFGSQPHQRFFPEKKDVRYSMIGFDKVEQSFDKDGKIVRSFPDPTIEEPPRERTSAAYCSEECQNVFCIRRRPENFGHECIWNGLMR